MSTLRPRDQTPTDKALEWNLRSAIANAPPDSVWRPRTAESRGVRLATADFLQGLREWDYFGTFTLRDDRTADAVCAKLRALAGYVARSGQMHLEVVWTLETQSRGVLHAHALLRVPEGLQISSRLIERSWSLGHARVVHYDPSKAPGRYMVKDSAEVHHFVGCSRERPCRRHAGCRFSTGVERSRA